MDHSALQRGIYRPAAASERIASTKGQQRLIVSPSAFHIATYVRLTLEIAAPPKDVDNPWFTKPGSFQ